MVIALYICIDVVSTCIIKTHGSELRGQEEAGLHDEPVSYTAVKLVNVLNKLP